MTFVDILHALYKAYSIDACFIADHMGLEDEEVEAWEKGKSFPTEEQLVKFSGMFAIPLNTLEKAVEQGKKESV